MIEERLDKLIEYLEELQPDTCPFYDAGINNKTTLDFSEELPFCTEEYCMNYGGAECWKRWIMGEKE